MRALALAMLLVPAVALADPSDDGYCDYVEGVADATSATQLAPQLIGQFGYIDQPAYAVTPDITALRAIGGVNYRLTGIYEGLATRAKAHADCRRHGALLRVKGASEARALAARVAVLDDAMREADKLLAEQTADLDARRATAQDVTAMRLRVEELRGLAEDAHRQLAALPPPDDRPLDTALATFQAADADMEVADGKLRTAQAYSVSVRAGVDQFLDGPNPNTQYFALVEVDISLGALWLGGGNARAARGRNRYVRSGHDPLGTDVTIEQLKLTIDLEAKRAEQTQALVADLDRQLQALGKVGGEDSKRYRETVWFDWIKAKADLAYLTAHVAALRQVIGGGS